jgi:hypothetical protein
MVRLSQGHTPTWKTLALLGSGGSREQFCYFNCSGGRQDDNKRAPLMVF